MIKQFLLAGATLAFATSAHAAVLDFDTVGDCSGGEGATFTLLGGASCEIDGTPNGTTGLNLSNSQTFSQIRADFSSLVNSVSVDLGDFGADNDTVFIQAFDAFDNLLDSSSLSGLGSSLGNVAVAAADISYVIFGSDTGDIGFIAADNFAFESAQVVPLPAGGALLLTGLAAFGVMRRRK